MVTCVSAQSFITREVWGAEVASAHNHIVKFLTGKFVV